ncbi:MAG TPA: LamG-like jellyroll fold domain-containing protein [Chitinophagaceae bacterium]|nr:LamG-like jellyroll fold domain-containing protein [Chitinophagaceae bacterium]
MFNDKEHQQFYSLYAASLPGKFVVKDKWILLTVTYDGNEVILYADCEVIGRGEVKDYYFSNEEDLFLDKLDNPNYPYWFTGLPDEVRICNRVMCKRRIGTAL